MKNFVLATILTAALIGLFSWIDYRQQMFDCVNYWQPTEPTGNGSGTKRKGDSGLILPGDGESPADTFIEPESIPEQAEDEQASGSEVTKVTSDKNKRQKTSDRKQAISEELKEEHNKMNDIVLSFWHGVATVLIGETVALMVAVAWMKIRGGK